MKRLKILVIVGCIALVILLLCGCVKGTDNTRNDNTDGQHSDTTQQASNTHDSTSKNVNSQIEDSNVFFLGQFYEDRTWASGKGYLLIDKEGNVIAQITGAAEEPSRFDNGYSHFYNIERKKYYTINTNGEIVHQFTSDSSGEHVVACGGGYVLTEENISNFDTTGYQYRVYNVDGSENGSFFLKDSCAADYLGKGVFKISKGYYCAKGGIWISDLPYECYSHLVNSFEFDGENIIIGTTRSVDTQIPGILVLSSDGKIRTYYPEEMSIWSTVSALSDGVCVIYNNDGDNHKVISFDTLTGQSYFLGEDYWKRIPDDRKPQTPRDGRIPIAMKGADGKTYSAIFDTKLNLIKETQLGDFCGASDGRFIVYIRDSDNVVYSNSKLFISRDTVEVYNSNGEFLFSVSDREYSTYLGNTKVERYSCGALLVVEENSYHRHYLDTEGNLLFEKINYDKVKSFSAE